MKISKKSRVKNPENPGIPGIGIGIWKPQNIPKIVGFHGFLTIGIFSGFSKNPPDSGFFLSLGIFISGIRDFFRFQDFNPRESGFFSISGFFRDFLHSGYPGILHPRDRDVFSWDRISRHNATSGFECLKLENKDLLFCVSEYNDIY